jgi:hypothetical protein
MKYINISWERLKITWIWEVWPLEVFESSEKIRSSFVKEYKEEEKVTKKSKK